MLPRLEPEERLKQSDRVVLLLIGALVFGGFAVDVLTNFAWIKAGALVLFAAWLGLTVLHESAHALVATLLGWKVCRIVIGMGKPVFRFRVAGVPVQVCRYPIGGHVIPAPVGLEGAPWKSSLIFLAGPASEFAVLLVLAGLIGLDALLGTPTSFGVLSAQAIAIAALMGVVFNSIPITTEEGHVTDGLGVLVSFSLPRESFAERQALPYTVVAESQLLAGQPERAVVGLTEGARALGANVPALVTIAESLSEAAEPRLVIEVLEPLVARDDIPRSLQPRILATLAQALVAAAPDKLDEADAYSAHALELAPAEPRALLARARVLLELGQFHAAAAQVSRMELHMHEVRLVDARDTMYALVALRRGQRDQALQIVSQLEERGARGAELTALRAELGGVQGRSPEYA